MRKTIFYAHPSCLQTQLQPIFKTNHTTVKLSELINKVMNEHHAPRLPAREEEKTPLLENGRLLLTIKYSG